MLFEREHDSPLEGTKLCVNDIFPIFRDLAVEVPEANFLTVSE